MSNRIFARITSVCEDVRHNEAYTWTRERWLHSSLWVKFISYNINNPAIEVTPASFNRCMSKTFPVELFGIDNPSGVYRTKLISHDTYYYVTMPENQVSYPIMSEQWAQDKINQSRSLERNLIPSSALGFSPSQRSLRSSPGPAAASKRREYDSPIQLSPRKKRRTYRNREALSPNIYTYSPIKPTILGKRYSPEIHKKDPLRVNRGLKAYHNAIEKKAQEAQKEINRLRNELNESIRKQKLLLEKIEALREADYDQHIKMNEFEHQLLPEKKKISTSHLIK